MHRRSFLLSVAGSTGIGLAGCTGDGSSNGGQANGGQDTVEFTIAGSQVPAVNHIDSIFPEPIVEFAEEVEAISDGGFEVNVQAESALCGQANCPERVRDGVVQVAHTTLGNSTRQWPENDIWLLPYTFGENAAISHTFTKEATWENYWIPFAKRHGVLPMWTGTVQLRDVMIGVDAADQYQNIAAPADIQGLSARRTFSSVSAIVLNAWGANPVDLAWGDTIEGLRSGVVDGMETYISPALAYGMGESIAKLIVLQFMAGVGVFWMNVDWLSQLSDQHVQWLAEASRNLHTQTNRIADEVYRDRVGVQDPVPDDSPLAENDIEATFIEDHGAWMDPVHPLDNADLYSDIFSIVENLEGIDDGSAFHDYLWESARENAVPDGSQDYEIQSWWDDHLEAIV